MSLRELRTLAILTAIVLALTALVVNLKQQGDDQEYFGTLWLEDMDLNVVTRIEVIGPGNLPQVTLVRRPEGWGVEQREHYPAQVGVIRSLLLELSEAKRLERKTDDPTQHAQLGLGEIGAAGARGQQMILQTDDGTRTLRIGVSPSGRNATYVRTVDDDQSWLVDRTFRIPLEPRRWLAPDLIDIDIEQVLRMQIEHPDGERLEATRASGGELRFEAVNLPEGRQLKNGFVFNRLANAITTLSLEDVMPAARAERHLVDVIETRYELAQGYTLVARLFSRDTERYALFGVIQGTGIRDAHRVEAQRLARHLAGWAFRVPSFAYDSMALRWADVLAEPPQASEGE